jgi:transcriptional regulator with XRE-family HTH domain
MDYKELGKNIRKYRKKQNITIEELAGKCSISSNFLGKIERAQSIPSLETLVAIANGLNIGIDTLIKKDLNIKNNEIISKLGIELDNLSNEEKKSYAGLCCNHIAQFYINEHNKNDY